ncbi:MAG: LPS-assembly protein LptD [Gammaproteobacteria bacterium]
MPDVPDFTALTIVTQEPTPTLRRRSAPLQPHLEPTPIARALQVLVAAMALGAAASPAMVHAQQAGDLDHDGLNLRPGILLQETLSPELRQQAPTVVFGEQIEGKNDGNTVIQGDAELRRHDQVIRADRIEHDQSTGDTKAIGQVRIQRNGDHFSGPRLEMNVNTDKGFFEQPEYRLLQNEATGNASRVDFLDKDHVQIHQGTYSTCPRPPGGGAWKPDWLVRGKRIDLDQVEDVGYAYSGVLEFQDIPILAAPILSFPLSDERKSGFLSPTVGVGTLNGFEAKVPYYFNLAPNYDLTLTPTVMGKRGVDLEGDFRYLMPSLSGRALLAILPDDRYRNSNRWFYSHQHVQNIDSLFGDVVFDLNVNRASDASYWRDFERLYNNEWLRLLPSSAGLGWSRGPWSIRAGVNSYQNFRIDPDRITSPFSQLPYINATYGRSNIDLLGVSDWNYQFAVSGSRFERKSFDQQSREKKESGDRLSIAATFDRRWDAPGWFVHPKVRARGTAYQSDDFSGGPLSRTVAAPTLSLDSGLFFERETQVLGRKFIQTLEPRAFLTYTPFRDQSGLPNYDSAYLDYNFSSIFFEDIYGGGDRINDMKALTLGVSSRFLDYRHGTEVVRLGFAQRYYFDDINVTLPGQKPLSKGLGDMLLTGRVQWSRDFVVDSVFQFNQDTRVSSRKSIGMRYAPGDHKVISAAYRFQRDVSEQLDLGWQWPLSDLFGKLPGQVPGKAYGPGQWYTVGHINYSVNERKPIELIAGFEYDAGCWLGRVVLQRQQTGSTTRNQKILFQLEFNGFASLGTGSLQNLGNSIPRYKALRDGEIVPSRFENYD